MSESRSHNIPKFVSFLPKLSQHSPEDSRTKSVKVNDLKKQHSTGIDEESRDRISYHYRARRARSKSQENDQAASRPPKYGTDDHVQAELFVVDRKGDLNNLVYGSAHKYSVPPFHRYGSGRVLGASPELRIDRDIKDEKSIVLINPKSVGSREREKYVFARIERQKSRLLKIRPNTVFEEANTHEADFVPLQRLKGKKHNSEGAAAKISSGSEDDERNYRSIYTQTNSNDVQPDVDLRYATESESSGSENSRAVEFSSLVRLNNVHLSRKVEEYPYDIDAWLALINYQDQVIRGGDDRRRITNAETKSTAEIKIHMYEKALGIAKSREDREKLLIGLMAEGSKIWELKTQADRWEEISRTNIDSLTLYIRYLNFKQTTFSLFRYEEVKEVYLQRIRLLSRASAAVNSTEHAEPLYRQIIYVFLRLTIFIRESGYTELAVSIWQLLLEINFCGPAERYSTEQSTRHFKDFWESEVPRIGEDGAMGWCKFLEAQDISNVPNPTVDKPDDFLDNKSIFKSWASAERLRATNSSIPAKTMDEVIEDDPFRVILFSDIEDFVLLLPSDSENLQKLCVDAFLCFCRLPAIASLELVEWRNDAFVQGDILEHNLDWLMQQYKFPPSHDIENGKSILSTAPFTNVVVSSESLFIRSLAREPYRPRYTGTNEPVSYQWIRKCLSQLTQAWFNDSLAEYYLSFEFRNEPETVRKVSKRLLKQHPTSLRLYHAYGLIEWYRGNKDVAASVFSAALDMSRSISKNKSDFETLTLSRSWIWASLEDGDHISALKNLICIVEEVPNFAIELSPALILKAKQHFASNRDFLLSSNSVAHSTMHCECLALLEYLSGNVTSSSSQGDIDAALTVFDSFTRTLQKRAQMATLELFLQSAARLLYHHAHAGPFRPALIRGHLTRFLTIFPFNTMFLELYSWNESRLRIDNRVRNIFLTTVLIAQNDTLSSRLFAVHYETNNGTIHSVKAAFEHAVSSPVSESSAGLWRLYILFCLRTRQFRPQTKDVWLRALRACPWAKELYIIGFEKLSDTTLFKNLKSTWRVMGEKGLRVHIDLEDRFDEIVDLEIRELSHRRVSRQ